MRRNVGSCFRIRVLARKSVWGQHASLVTVAVEGAVCVDADVAAVGEEDVAAFVDIGALSVVGDEVSWVACARERPHRVGALMAALRDAQAAFVNIDA